MTNREQAEMVAKFRTPPGLDWHGLADDIETLLDAKDKIAKDRQDADDLAGYGWRDID